MNIGKFRDGHPRLTLTLRGVVKDIDIEFIIDTGFDGDMVIPRTFAGSIDAVFTGHRDRAFADGHRQRLPAYETVLDWNEGERVAEFFVLDGQPLIGTSLLSDLLLTVEISEGGDVILESL